MSARFGAVGASGSQFNPASLGWEALYYPGGSAFQAEGYTNGEVLNAGKDIPDGSGNGNDAAATETDTTLTYAASSNVNGKPAIRGASLSSGDHPAYENYLSTGLTSYSVVLVWYQDTILESFSMLFHDVYSYNRCYLNIAQDGRVVIRTNYHISSYTAAGVVTAGNTYGFRFNITPTQATGHLDASQIYSRVAAMNTFSGVEMFMQNGSSWPFSGDLAFLGVYDGDVTGHADWSSFADWVSSQFGATI